MFNSSILRIPIFTLALLWLCAGALGWSLPSAGYATKPQPPQRGGIRIQTPPGQPLTAQERAQAVAVLLANPRVAALIGGHKVRAIRVTHGFEETAAASGKQEHYRVTVVLFDYTTGTAMRFILDPASGALVGEQLLRGRPQASEEEIQLATRIIQQDAELADLLSPSGKLIGGFIVDGPPGSPPNHRFMQMRIVTDDLRETKRVVIVDLTDDVIASK